MGDLRDLRWWRYQAMTQNKPALNVRPNHGFGCGVGAYVGNGAGSGVGSGDDTGVGIVVGVDVGEYDGKCVGTGDVHEWLCEPVSYGTSAGCSVVPVDCPIMSL